MPDEVDEFILRIMYDTQSPVIVKLEWRIMEYKGINESLGATVIYWVSGNSTSTRNEGAF